MVGTVKLPAWWQRPRSRLSSSACASATVLCGRSPLESFFDFAASEAAGAHTDTSGRSVNQRADALQVGVERPFRLVIGVTDVMSRLVLFGADLTYECHEETPSQESVIARDSSIGYSALTSLPALQVSRTWRCSGVNDTYRRLECVVAGLAEVLTMVGATAAGTLMSNVGSPPSSRRSFPTLYSFC